VVESVKHMTDCDNDSICRKDQSPLDEGPLLDTLYRH
jgi:hypothetical protein